MKTILPLCIMLLLGRVTVAHNYPDFRDTGAKYPVDTCKLLVAYDFCFVKDTVGMIKLHDRKLLEIGSRTNRYYSLYADMIDSMAYNHYLSIPKNDIARLEAGIDVWSWLETNEIALYCDVYTSPRKGKLLVSTRFRHEDYQYEEPVEPIEWRVTDQTDTIVGYVCLRADATFRGRTWSVWFAPDIPHAFGPWKLMGLPGLILKASSNDGLFSWTAIGLMQPQSRMIYDYADKALHGLERHPFVVPSHKKIKCSRKDIDRLWKLQWLAPLTLMFLDGQEHSVYDMSTHKEVKIDINDVPNAYYPKLELDI